MPRERCLLARPVARVDGLGLARDRSCGRLDSSRPGRGRQPDHITSDAGYLSRSALAERGEQLVLTLRWFKEADHSRPSRPLMESGTPTRRVRPALRAHVAVFFPLGRRPRWVFFTSNRFCVNCSWLLVRSLPGRCSQTHFPTWPRPEKERQTTLSGGSLGSCVDEERSQLRELM